MAKTLNKKSIYNFEDNLLFPKLDTFCGNNLTRIFQATFGLTLLFGFLLFDPLISQGGDDSGYLLSAKRFLDGTGYPSFHGAFYSIFLALVMKVTGFHLILFKSLSLIFILGQHIFFYKTLKHRVSPFILSGVLLLSSVNSGVLYFGSQTYTEAFFMLLQSLFLFVFIAYVLLNDKIVLNKAKGWFTFLVLGFLLFAMSSTRNVGIVALLAAVSMLIIQKRWIHSALTILGFLLIKIPWSIYKRSVWGITESDLSSQFEIMIRKYPYNPTMGTESFGGLFVRFFENIKIYLSGIFLQETGFSGSGDISGNYVLAAVVVAVLVVGIILAFRTRQKIMQFVFVYLAISLGVMFFSVSQLWSQSRLIITYIPLLLLSILWTLATISKITNRRWIIYLPIAIILFSFFRTFPASLKEGADKREIVKEYSENKFFGYTPDMVNFLRASEWAAANIPEAANIASRKASMSFIYGQGREFFSIHKLPYVVADSVLNNNILENKNCFIIDESRFAGKPIQSVYEIKPYLHALISADSIIYGVYLEENNQQRIDSLFNSMGLSVYTNAENFKKEVLSKATEVMALVPNQLLDHLRTNNVHFIISANLRLDINRKSKQTINTIKRYMATINAKYPGIFNTVMTFGQANEEPAYVIQINYALSVQE